MWWNVEKSCINLCWLFDHKSSSDNTGLSLLAHVYNRPLNYFSHRNACVGISMINVLFDMLGSFCVLFRISHCSSYLLSNKIISIPRGVNRALLCSWVPWIGHKCMQGGFIFAPWCLDPLLEDERFGVTTAEVWNYPKAPSLRQSGRGCWLLTGSQHSDSWGYQPEHLHATSLWLLGFLIVGSHFLRVFPSKRTRQNPYLLIYLFICKRY